MRIYNWFHDLPDCKWWGIGSNVVIIIIGGVLMKFFYNKFE